MTEFKASSENEKQQQEEQDFASILREERKRLRILSKHIDRLLWEIEKEMQLGEGKESRLSELNKRLRGLLDAYDKIVKRLKDLRENPHSLMSRTPST